MSEHLNIKNLQIENPSEGIALFGPNDSHLKTLEQTLDVDIVTRGGGVAVTGEEETAQLVEDVLNALLSLIRKGINITDRDVIYAVQLSYKGILEELDQLFEEEITTNIKGRPIRSKTLGQRHYINAIKKNDLVFGIGPAGTGKTYLAVVMAVKALKEGKVKRIILTRPAVEAGESLGFLPGDLKEKVDPYLRPLYDALHDLFGVEHTERLIERGTIEIAPLAYMRGRTLDEAFVILDEAQNTTPEQMKMFLTRLGFGSKMIITGDITQIDLPRGKESGLRRAQKIFKDIQGIRIIHMQQSDVVRHPLVQKIINAYEVEDHD
ncbi:PhoH family protein [Pseudalkalibacillus salsuginis]|uniref:PhoH family protein n=1 Tax=Pseudalkalibacillus salsuginis TaxID=2910972 RepID=UPI001F2DDF24|nr:PhoH family protein [Pseudalkalibacillus salsuginis]MCF6408530.1 PhoH family protein [Pseudalkalibacillus salsuginis]